MWDCVGHMTRCVCGSVRPHANVTLLMPATLECIPAPHATMLGTTFWHKYYRLFGTFVEVQ